MFIVCVSPLKYNHCRARIASVLFTAKSPIHRTVPGTWQAFDKHLSSALDTENCVTDQTILLAFAERRPCTKLVANI